MAVDPTWLHALGRDRLERVVFVRGIQMTATVSDKVAAMFRRFGEIETVDSWPQRDYALLTFRHPEGKRRALAESEICFQGAPVQVLDPLDRRDHDGMACFFAAEDAAMRSDVLNGQYPDGPAAPPPRRESQCGPADALAGEVADLVRCRIADAYRALDAERLAAWAQIGRREDALADREAQLRQRERDQAERERAGVLRVQQAADEARQWLQQKEEREARFRKIAQPKSARVRLSVGGQPFETTAGVLASDPACTLLMARDMAREDGGDGTKEIFIDRDPSCFHLVLNHLRGDGVDLKVLSDGWLGLLMEDCVAYGVDSLAARISAERAARAAAGCCEHGSPQRPGSPEGGPGSPSPPLGSPAGRIAPARPVSDVVSSDSEEIVTARSASPAPLPQRPRPRPRAPPDPCRGPGGCGEGPAAPAPAGGAHAAPSASPAAAAAQAAVQAAAAAHPQAVAAAYAAAPAARGGGGGGGAEWTGPPRPAERRRDPNNGVAYTAAEFESYYGTNWQQVWASAVPITTHQYTMNPAAKPFTPGSAG